MVYPRTTDSTKTSLRIRPKNITVRELNLTEEQVNEANKIIASPVSRQQRLVKLKQVLKGNSCCVCGGLPSVEIVYYYEKISQRERYCDIHQRLVFQRSEPQKTQKELAQEWGCVVGSISGARG